MKYQKLSNKLAEVKFRVKIANQQCKNIVSFENERTFPQMHAELKRRTQRTYEDFKKLKKRNVDFSTFLEIGSEYCERPMIIEKKFGVKGFAADISLASLQTADEFRKPLGFKNTPARIVLDANNLPFADNSLPFIFCYQTLHHFPNPKPVIDEIYRVLKPSGYFFFDEEPVKQTLNINLWRRPTQLRPWEKALKYIGILPFISRIGKTEVDYGILEEVFDLGVWEMALNVFDKVEAKTKPFPIGPTSLKLKTNNKSWIRPSFLTWFLISWWGGGIGALCQKKGEGEGRMIKDIWDALSCPDCLNKTEGKIKKNLKIIRNKNNFSCSNCKRIFPYKNNILVLLPKKEMATLYAI